MLGLSKLRPALVSFRLGGVLRSVPSRKHGLVYRGAIMPSRKQFWKGEMVCGAMWFWILWRFYHDPEEVLGHNPWPDASKWTDEELGIPPDDED